MKTIPLRSQAASTLVVVISVLATLMVVVGIAAEYTYTVQRHVQRSNTLAKRGGGWGQLHRDTFRQLATNVQRHSKREHAAEHERVRDHCHTGAIAARSCNGYRKEGNQLRS